MIETRNLSKKFGQNTVLDNLNFSVSQGEIFCFLGANGAGKTTTINLLLGFLKPTSGEAFIHKMIVLIAVPISISALSIGYRNHKNISFLPIGIAGLLILILAVLLGENILGEYGEKGLTLLGSIFISYSHYRNYKICIESDCSCH